jgi:hypothetical protein
VLYRIYRDGDGEILVEVAEKERKSEEVTTGIEATTPRLAAAMPGELTKSVPWE